MFNVYHNSKMSDSCLGWVEQESPSETSPCHNHLIERHKQASVRLTEIKQHLYIELLLARLHIV